MSGDLERMNAAEKEIIGIEDTLYQLHLLVDTSKSASVRGDTLTETIIDGSVSVLSDYDITPYATDPLHEEKVMKILSNMGVMDTTEKIDTYIHKKYISSPVTGEMVMSASDAYNVDARLMMAIMEQDSRFGTAGVAVRTLNPGNVGNTDDGSTRTYDSWQEGVTAVAEWLNRHRTSSLVTEVPEETDSEPVATSTPSTATPTATSTTTTTTTTWTTVTSTSTPSTATSTSPTNTGTSTPPTLTPPNTATSTPPTLTPPSTATSTPSANTGTSTPPTLTSPVNTATSTSPSTTTSTSTPSTASSTPPTLTPPTNTATSTPGNVTETETPTPNTNTSTPTTETADAADSPQAGPLETVAQETTN